MGHTLPVFFCNHQASAQVEVKRFCKEKQGKTLALEAEKELSVFLGKRVFGATSSWWLVANASQHWPLMSKDSRFLQPPTAAKVTSSLGVHKRSSFPPSLMYKPLV